jgi:hypothetical protein
VWVSTIVIPLLLAVACGAPAGTWSPVPVPDPALPGDPRTVLDAVSCAPDTCLAVGRGAALRWDSTSWQAVPAPPLWTAAAVSCVSARWCLAVGTDSQPHMQAVTWDGDRWGAPVTGPLGELTKVACASPTRCLALGKAYGQPVNRVVAFDGATLSEVPTLHPGDAALRLTDVSCGGEHLCAVAGASGDRPVIDAWDGAAGRDLAPPVDGGTVSSISCPTEQACLAGSRTAAGVRVLTWDGVSWSTRALPEARDPSSLSCATATSCVLVTTPATIAYHLDGGTWFPFPYSVPFYRTTAVSCGSPTSCAAIGEQYPRTVAHFDGDHWLVHRGEGLAGPPASAFEQVSCVSASWCTAVGWADDLGRDRPIIGWWNAGSWHVDIGLRVDDDTTALDDDSDTRLAAVSCTTTTFCVAGGFAASDRTTWSRAVLRVWNGRRWADAVLPGSAMTRPIRQVACVGTDFCLAVGDTAAVAWDGSTWRAVPRPDGVVSYLSCSRRDRCVASAGLDNPGLWTWDGAGWTGVTGLPSQPDGGFVPLGVSCVAGGRCAALVSAAGGELLLTDDGPGWTEHPVPAGSRLVQLSCTAARCVALGFPSASAPVPTLVWDGRTWSTAGTAHLGAGQVADDYLLPMTGNLSCSGAGCMRVAPDRRPGTDLAVAAAEQLRL